MKTPQLVLPYHTQHSMVRAMYLKKKINRMSILYSPQRFQIKSYKFGHFTVQNCFSTAQHRRCELLQSKILVFEHFIIVYTKACIISTYDDFEPQWYCSSCSGRFLLIFTNDFGHTVRLYQQKYIRLWCFALSFIWAFRHFKVKIGRNIMKYVRQTQFIEKTNQRKKEKTWK